MRKRKRMSDMGGTTNFCEKMDRFMIIFDLN